MSRRKKAVSRDQAVCRQASSGWAAGRPHTGRTLRDQVTTARRDHTPSRQAGKGVTQAGSDESM